MLAWHKHDHEDELFYICKGSLKIEYEDSEVMLNEGDFHIVPKGKMHNPVAESECWIMLIETVTTAHYWRCRHRAVKIHRGATRTAVSNEPLRRQICFSPF